MAVPSNIITAADIDGALDQEFIRNFKGEFDRLAELLGIFGVSTRPAGTALYQYSVSGSLNNSATGTTVTSTYALTEDEALVSGKTYYTRSGSGTTASPYTYAAVAASALNVSNIATYYERTDTVTALGSSSGTAYVEGDEVALSEYAVSRTSIGDLSPVPYRKMTTVKAILQDGYEKAVIKTDRKMVSQIRAQLISQLFTFLGTGTGAPADGVTVNTLQKALAYGDAALQNALETNGDQQDRQQQHSGN